MKEIKKNLITDNCKLSTILVTGSAGFIGFHVAKRLLEKDYKVIGIDNLNDYYDTKLKKDRNKILKKYKDYKFYFGKLENINLIKKIFSENKIDKVCNLGAQAGVRYSIENPHLYIQSNIVGFTNLIEESKNAKVENFIYASSSSVYGNNKKTPFSVEDRVDEPISLYAATKKSNELIAYTYHHLFDMSCTGLRFFTVYGPWGRPDMAYFSFTKNIIEGKLIRIYNHGKMKRDFTYIDDIVDGIIKSLDQPSGYKIYNLGNNKPVNLNYFIECLEKAIGMKAKKEYAPLQPGDVLETYADIELSKKELGFQPKVKIEEGLKKFIEWYKSYYHIN